MDIRLICFDLGGVLIDICHTWSEAVEVAGVDASNTSAGTLIDCPSITPYQGGQITIEQYLGDLATYLGLASPMRALSVHNSILKEEHEGVADLICELNEKGFATACLSNTNAPHWREMNESGRFPGFQQLQHKIASHEVGLNKPDLAIFRQFEELTGYKPEQIAFFDDHGYNVEGATAAGWHAALINNQGDTAAQMRQQLTAWGVLG